MIMFRQYKKRICAVLICLLLILAVTACTEKKEGSKAAGENGIKVAVQEVSPSKEPYGKEEVTYPYWKEIGRAHV